MNLNLLQSAIETKLEEIEKILGPNYKLTLIASHNGAGGLKDADLLLTTANRESIMRAVDKFLPNIPHHPRQPGNEAGNTQNL